MVFWLWVALGGLTLAVIALWIKCHLLQKSAEEICRGFAQRLTAQTNTLIDISCRDRHMMKPAAEINEQLKALRSQRHRFQKGDAARHSARDHYA